MLSLGSLLVPLVLFFLYLAQVIWALRSQGLDAAHVLALLSSFSAIVVLAQGYDLVVRDKASGFSVYLLAAGLKPLDIVLAKALVVFVNTALALLMLTGIALSYTVLLVGYNVWGVLGVVAEALSRSLLTALALSLLLASLGSMRGRYSLAGEAVVVAYLVALLLNGKLMAGLPGVVLSLALLAACYVIVKLAPREAMME
jgi:ABC-type transport system involved in multi-copper enzyme maturation permease subunit